ncbi:MAG TPA: hypothetical protein VKZ79_22415 [Alphaproteobacteria bacterium]|nr:hypothetical protein [Alphaproteobacteria bacterium]
MFGSNISAIKERAKVRWDKLTDEDLDSATKGVGALASRLSDRYGYDLEEARRQAERFFNSSAEIARSAYGRALRTTNEASLRIDGLVRENPWRAVLGAALLGAAVGYALGWSERRNHW